jgi:hypothetical protein
MNVMRRQKISYADASNRFYKFVCRMMGSLYEAKYFLFLVLQTGSLYEASTHPMSFAS